jgi:hypothetical protein
MTDMAAACALILLAAGLRLLGTPRPTCSSCWASSSSAAHADLPWTRGYAARRRGAVERYAGTSRATGMPTVDARALISRNTRSAIHNAV